jgi:ankyrin repeat protein
VGRLSLIILLSKALLDRGASIETKNSDHETALDLAVRKKHKLVINEFVIHGHFDTDRDERGKLCPK